MTLTQRGFWSSVGCVALAAGLSAQTATQPPSQPGQAQAQESPVFRVTVDAVTTDVIVKDANGQFLSDLSKDDFEIYEDGVKQDVATMTMSHGGRVTNLLEAPPPAAPEGIILPPVRRVNDTTGRIFLFFVDDLNLQFQRSGQVRELFKKVAKNLLHDGDLYGIVSSGPSSISVDVRAFYASNRQAFDDAVKRMTGDGMKPSDIINGASGPQGPSELRHRAHVAFSTMHEALLNLERVHNRRKALVWVSEGYDFNPFQDSRLGLNDINSPFMHNQMAALANSQTESGRSPGLQEQAKGETFSDADLARELNELTRAANRANTTIYTIDPRGLIAGGDIDEQVDPQEWSMWLRKTQDSMRVLAEQTGGLAVVSTNYYVLGYYSNNIDPTKRRRKIEVKVKRPDVEVISRTEYVLRPAGR